MSELKDLEKAWKDAEAEAVRIQNEKDAAIDKIRDRYTKRQQQANQKAADAQKRFCDATAANALLDHPDGQNVARSLVASGALDRKTVEAAGITLDA